MKKTNEKEAMKNDKKLWNPHKTIYIYIYILTNVWYNTNINGGYDTKSRIAFFGSEKSFDVANEVYVTYNIIRNREDSFIECALI